MAKNFKTGGRKKGTPNKCTQELRNAYAYFMDVNKDKMQELFDKVAATNPIKALEFMIKVSEFVLPKLKAIETSQTAQELQKIIIEVVDAPRTTDGLGE